MKGFKVLFAVVIHHDYFESGFCRDIQLKPTQASIEQAKNSGIVFKPCIGGLLVLCDLDKMPVLTLYIKDEGLFFEFYITSSNPDLSHYSELSLLKDEELLWLKYASPELSTLDANNRYILLSTCKWISSDDYNLKSEITHYSEQEALTLPNKAFMFISIVINESEFDTLVSDNNPSSPPFTFFAALENKSAYWEYRVQGRFTKNNIEVVDRDEKVKFNVIKNETLIDGNSITTYRSDEKVKLKEFSESYFQLIDKRANGHRVLIKRLPVAHFSNGYQELVGTKLTQISEIFVNC